MSLYGKAVRLVTDLLDEMQGGVLCPEDQRRRAPGRKQLFLPRAAFLALGYRHQRHVVHAELHEDSDCDR
ncbi:hypothetical protein D3C83_41860 [compost metagenome]